MEVRHAAKSLLRIGDDRLVFVSGITGRQNLVGGGIDAGEKPKGALLREGNEEIKDFTEITTEPEELFTIEGPITTATGEEKIAHWTVFDTVLLVPSVELQIPTDSEVVAVSIVTPKECYEHPRMSDLARRAVLRAHGR